jgi:hypothetical protein
MGMTLGSHMTPLSRSYIEKADVVFAGVSDRIIELWLAKIRPDVLSLRSLECQRRGRDPYKQMVEAMLTDVRAGKTVCGIFYGHPGVFSWPPHEALETARKEGYRTHVEPAISAEDCLYADLGIDPGKYGCQHYEVSQLMLFKRCLDVSAYLILWQDGAADDPLLSGIRTTMAYRRILVDVLARDYDLEHEVIIYRAPMIPTQKPDIDRVKLRLLSTVAMDSHATLVLAPARKLEADPVVRERLDAMGRGDVKP